MKDTPLNIISPVHGDMLHAADAVNGNGASLYPVVVAAPSTAAIMVDGIPASYAASLFTAFIPLDHYENKVVATNRTTGDTTSITVFRLTKFAGRTRLSIDDNIWFLQDLHDNGNQYTSLFDNPYLGSLKKLHDIYGTKMHFNLFYQTEGFNLSQLGDKFRAEWQANADWMRLSFHALQEKPDMPYKTAGYETVKKDCDLVVKEIHRFAGESLTGPVTTIHWGEATVEGSRALRDAGYHGQLGYFNVDDQLPAVSYYLDVEKRRNIKKRFIWKDIDEDIIFIRSSIVLDKTALHGIVPVLDQYEKTSRKPPYADFLIHEQYFYPFYEAYQDDYIARMETALQWAAANDYTPAFLGDCIFE